MAKNNLNDMTKLLRQSYPMLLIDKVVSINKNKAQTIKYITNSDPFMEGHFKSFKVYPVVLLVEVLAQSAAFPIYKSMGFVDDIWFLSIDRCHCHSFLVPGDIATSTVSVSNIDSLGVIKCQGTITNQNNEKVLDAKFKLIKKKIQN